MTRIQLAIFPAILLGILIIVLFASLANANETVQAYNYPTNTLSAAKNTPLTARATPLIATSVDTQTTGPSPTAADEQPSVRSPTAANTQPATVSQSAQCPISSRYPGSIRQWCGLIEKYADPVNLEPNLVAAMMLQESGGNPQAYSPSGAVGLMQIMPRDGLAASFQCGNTSCFASRPSMAQLYDPDYNISYGVRMIAALIQKTGTIRDALRSYGPINVGYYYADKVLNIYQSYQ